MMSKTVSIRGRLNAADYNRVLLTDTSPFEVPIIFSNNNFYLNVLQKNTFRGHMKIMLSTLFSKHSYTIPFRYNIAKDSTSVRQLSLLHPAAQIDVCNFYQEHENLICYYSSIGQFSIRSPNRIGSAFYFPSKISEKNKYRGNSVDTTEIDKLVRNPASYFAYNGYDRLHKFFGSIEFVNIEKNFAHMLVLDVSKCFGSIYTHSVAWALKNINLAKKNIHSNHFGSHFDSLMQKMNYNETNGICVGPEVSRIFAEIILNRVDLDIDGCLVREGMQLKRDYLIRRYVDNYYVFCNSPDRLELIKSVIASCLGEYKLHLNDHKTIVVDRPFYTRKSKVIDNISSKLSEFFELFIGSDHKGGTRYNFPKPIRRYNSLYKHIIREIKSACSESNSSYEDVSSYIISAVSRRITNLVDDVAISLAGDNCDEESFVEAVILLLEISFFFYTMNPTVAASLTLSKSIVIGARSFEERFKSRLPFFQDRVVRWTMQLIRDARVAAITKRKGTIPVEVLNVLIAMHDIAADYNFNERMYREILFNDGKMDYFSAVSCLYIIKDRTNCEALRQEIFEKIRSGLVKNPDFLLSSQDVHLFLDVISCLYIRESDRIKLYKDIVVVLKIKKANNAEALQAIQECESANWFVSWKGVDLLSLITRKQLSAVY
ncbi:RNA-directed DNA polymerase [Methylobacterium sp. WL64]|uniref:antiviral reverse transcriptase Drt3b n=1 Tax=Methylobacterium sp. WL64 TaxID=2603894 RepID=UPI0011C84AA6|nr:antiviral reverse transcriptase Drt3b [Methylobacterium sp. WL64]TXM98578.1 RNA-directed DNA polymerase [Methylobacterium sp. WL64]